MPEFFQPKQEFSIAFLLSGSGSTLENLLEHIQNNKVKANIKIVISSKENAYGLERARKWAVPYQIVPYKLYKNDPEEYSNAITDIIDKNNIDLVVMGGFMSLYLVPNHLNYKVINIHPSLIPAFSGKGYYGDKVHKAVIDFGVKYTGCTIHFVDQIYDHGAIIAQSVVSVDEDETLETLKEKVGIEEKKLYPKVIQKFVDNKITIQNNKVKII